MISEYWEEFKDSTPRINKKQVTDYEEYLKEHEVQEEDWFEYVRHFYGQSRYARSTRRNYKYGMHVYIEQIIHKKKHEGG